MPELNRIDVAVCDSCLVGSDKKQCDTLGCAFMLRDRPALAGTRNTLRDLVDVTKEKK